jgi:two-component system, cell cycle sensor histidine kinase and response regulator CckA
VSGEDAGAWASSLPVLRAVIGPALRSAADALASGEPPADRESLRELLAAAAERAQRDLGDRARDPRVHAVVGAAASAAMALSLSDGVVPDAEIRGRVIGGLAQLRAESWSPEDQDPAR